MILGTYTQVKEPFIDEMRSNLRLLLEYRPNEIKDYLKHEKVADIDRYIKRHGQFYEVERLAFLCILADINLDLANEFYTYIERSKLSKDYFNLHFDKISAESPALNTYSQCRINILEMDYYTATHYFLRDNRLENSYVEEVRITCYETDPEITSKEVQEIFYFPSNAPTINNIKIIQA